MPDPKLAKELFSRIYEGAMTPLAPEWEESQDESTLVSGGEFGRNNKLVNKVWPGGAHIPGLREVYNEGLRPLTSVLGLFSEGMARGGGNMKAPAAGIVRTPEGIILKEESAGLLSKLLGRLKQGESLENIPLAERQKAMGMDDVVYHGTKIPDVPRGLLVKDITLNKDYPYLKTKFGIDGDLGLHVDHKPLVANNAIGATKLPEGMDPGVGKYATGDRIFKLKARITNPADLPDYGKWNDPYTVIKTSNPQVRGNMPDIEKQMYEEASQVISKHGGQARGERTRPLLPKHFERVTEEWDDRFPQILKENGYDAVRYNNNAEGHGGSSIMILDPHQVRMDWAKFDPRKLGAGDLLAFNGSKPSMDGTKDELLRLMKIRASKKVVDKAKEGIDTMFGDGPKRTEDIELK